MRNAPTNQQRRRLGVLLATATVTLVALAVAGVAAGQPAPAFSLPATDGSVASLAAQRGHPVVLVFVPSVLCDMCREQLRAIEEVLPTLRAGGWRRSQ